MNFLRSVRRNPFRNRNLFQRGLSSGHQVHKGPHTMAEQVWGDYSLYPLITVMIMGIAGPIGFGIYKMITDPDARITKKKRKSLFRNWKGVAEDVL